MNDPRASPLAHLLPLYLVVFIGFVGYAMIMTLFVPMLMHDHGYLSAGTPTGRRTALLGLLLAAYPAGQFIGSPVIGALSDRLGRKRVLLASLIVATLCYAAIAISLEHRALGLLAAALFVCGLAESNVTLTQSAIADATSPAGRGRLFAYVYVSVSLGYIAGPLLGGQIAQRYGYAAPFWMVLGLLVATVLWIATAYDDTAHRTAPGRPSQGYLRAFATLGGVFTDRPIRRLYLVNLLLFLGVYGFWRMAAVYMVDEWHMLQGQMTLFFSTLAFAALLANLFATPALMARYAYRPLFIALGAAGGLATIVAVAPPAELAFLAVACLAAALITMALSVSGALLSSAVDEARQGAVMGNNQALQVGAQAAGAAAGGLLASLFVPLPLIVFGALVIASALVLWSRRPGTTAEDSHAGR